MGHATPAAPSFATFVLRHVAALGLVAVCCLGRWLADPLLEGNLTMLPAAVATVIAARWLGAGPGILAVFVGLVAGDLLFARPKVDWARMLVRDAGVVVTSSMVGLLVVWTVTRLRKQADLLSREIASRRAAEAEVEAERHRFEQFLDAAPLCAYLKDSNGRFVYLNRHMQEVYPDVAAGSTVHSTFSVAEADEFTHNDSWVQRTGEPIACEEIATGPDGVTRHWSSYKFPVVDEAGRRGVGGLSIEITDRKHADERVTHTESLLRRLIEVQEREKQFLCHEFHDGLMQYAIAARMMLETERQHLPEAQHSSIDEVIRCIDAGIADGRRTLRGIRPTVLDDLGLTAAVEELASGLTSGGLQVDLTVAGDIDRVGADIKTTAFRIIQEAATNARRHSGTQRLRIALRTEGDDLVLEVEDFGRGFDSTSPPRTGFGIMGMAERARLAGGSFTIESVPGRGTHVQARLSAEPVEALICPAIEKP